MSVSKWAYTPWKCDGQPCPGDCDHCPKAYEDESDKPTDLISRADAIAYIDRVTNSGLGRNKSLDYIHKYISSLPSADVVDVNDVTIHYKPYPSAEAEWIPCNKQMPNELEAVNVTWVNHNPPPYYKHIEDVPLVDSAVYYRGKWYWWDATVIDVLAEYGEDCNAEQIDKDIEILAWMPLPKPYREESEVEE